MCGSSRVLKLTIVPLLQSIAVNTHRFQFGNYNRVATGHPKEGLNPRNKCPERFYLGCAYHGAPIRGSTVESEAREHMLVLCLQQLFCAAAHPTREIHLQLTGVRFATARTVDSTRAALPFPNLAMPVAVMMPSSVSPRFTCPSTN